MSKEFSQVSELVTDSTVFTWTINNFLAFPADVKESIESSTFKCLNTECSLRVFPNGRRKDSESVVLVVRRAVSSPSSYVSHKIGLKDVRGEVCYTDCIKLNIPNEDPVLKDGWTIIHKDSLMRKKAEFLRDGRLTVYCRVEVTELKNDAVVEKTYAGEEEKRRARELSQSLKNLFDSYQMTNPAMKVGEVSIPAHEVIRENIFRIFDAMYDDENRKDLSVDISDLKLCTVGDLLRYIYLDWEDDLPMDRVMDIYVFAQKFHMGELTRLSRWDIIGSTKYEYGDRLCDVALLAEKHGDAVLAKAVRDVFQDNFKDIIDGDAWKSMLKQNPALCMNIVAGTLVSGSPDEGTSGNSKPKRLKYC